MNGLAAGVHHALQIALIGADQHPAREEVARIETADGLEVEEPVFRHMADQKADLVHMAEQHDLGRFAIARRRIPAAEEGAHRVGLHMVEQPFDLTGDQIAHAVLAPRNAGGFAKVFK